MTREEEDPLFRGLLLGFADLGIDADGQQRLPEESSLEAVGIQAEVPGYFSPGEK